MDFPEERALYEHDPRLNHYTPNSLRALKETLLSGQGEKRTTFLRSIMAYIERSDRVDPKPFLEYLLKDHEHCKSIAKINSYNAALFLNRLGVVDWLTSHFMETRDLRHAVKQIAKYQNRESARMFLEAMDRLDSDSNVPTLITDILNLTVQPASFQIQALRSEETGQVECEKFAIEKPEILFTHSKPSFGWPGGFIIYVVNLEKLSLYLENKCLQLLAIRQCYPI